MALTVTYRLRLAVRDDRAWHTGCKTNDRAIEPTRENQMSRRLAFLSAAAALALAIPATAASANELNIYSHRQPFLLKPFIDAYTKKTGTKVNVVYASKGLAQRMLSEGEQSPADVVLTVDIARLMTYVENDLLAKVSSQTLGDNIPANLRDPEGRWYAFSTRARVIAVSKKVSEEDAPKRYEDLADEKYKGRLCSRPGSHVYNRALVASVIATAGTDAAQTWANGVVANLARRPQGNDRAQAKAIHEGECDFAIMNSYYYGAMKFGDRPEQKKWADAIRLVFPNQEGRGAHVNVSGGGVAKFSKNKEEAVRFLEFLTSQEAQTLYGTVNYEYPSNPSVKPTTELQSWGDFKADTLPLSKVADLAPEAQKVIDRAGW